MSKPTTAPTRKPAPKSVVSMIRGRDLRKELIDQLDAENPEFVHSYQKPELLGDKPASVQWEMETKGQELVKDDKGRPLHHMEDPVVRQNRKEFEAFKKMEGDNARETVESVVKSVRSTVRRNKKVPPENTEK